MSWIDQEMFKLQLNKTPVQPSKPKAKRLIDKQDELAFAEEVDPIEEIMFDIMTESKGVENK
jgi:hypothetical protein